MMYGGNVKGRKGGRGRPATVDTGRQGDRDVAPIERVAQRVAKAVSAIKRPLKLRLRANSIRAGSGHPPAFQIPNSKTDLNVSMHSPTTREIAKQQMMPSVGSSSYL